MPPQASAVQPSTRAGPPYARGKKSPMSLHNDNSADYKKALQVRSHSSGRLLGTPAKASSRPDSGVGKIHRPDTEEHLATALAGRRWDSVDLVEHTFGEIVPVSLAARILLVLLRHQLIEVVTESGGEAPDLPQPQLWVEACLDAAQRLDLRLRNRGAAKRSPYSWRWSAFDNDGTEGDGGASEFFNTVGALSYAVAGRIDSQFNSKYAYRNRFTFLKKGASFCGWEEQDCRPDIISLPVDAFQSSTPVLDPFVAVDTPSKILGQLLRSDPPRPSVTAEAESSDSSSGQEQCLWGALRRQLEEALGAQSGIDDYALPPACLHNAVDTRRINWAGLTATGELKSQSTANSVRQDFIYMEMQRLAQPYLRSVLGLGLTPTDITLIRADGMGTEECRLRKKSGWGVLEIIRLTLGLAVADRKQLGAHPFFELDEALTDVDLFSLPPNPKVLPEPPKTAGSMAVATSAKNESAINALASVGSKRKADDQLARTIPDKRVKSQRNEWKAFRASFVTIPDPVDPAKNTRYYLDYLADNRGGLVGRSTRVWCAYQELRDKGSIEELVRPEDISRAMESFDAGGRIFVGPFALKIQNVDMTSASYQQDICAVLKQKADEDPEGSRFLLLPERSWKSGNVLEDVRGLTEDNVPAGLAKHLVNRREIISVSLFKRTVGHCQSMGEFGRAIANILQAILWLKKQGVVHRDISRGNVLLAQEEPTRFTEPRRVVANGKPILLCRRRPSQVPNVYGVLHDLDMACMVPESDDIPGSATPEQEDNQGKKHSAGSRLRSVFKKREAALNAPKDTNNVKFRTGTPPYMAIDLLLGKVKGYHTAHYDVESVFYVLYLYPFDALPPPEEPVYPNPLKRPSIAFPDSILKWVKGTDLDTLGSTKMAFFEDDEGTWTNAIHDSNNLKRLWNLSGDNPSRGFDDWCGMVDTFHQKLWDGLTRIPAHQTDIEGITESMLELSAEIPL